MGGSRTIHRRSTALALVAFVAVGLVSPAAHAHHYEAGGGAEQLMVSPDGSEPVAPGADPGLPATQEVSVAGKDFIAGMSVDLYECAGRSNYITVPTNCFPLGSAQVAADGTFTTTARVSVYVRTPLGASFSTEPEELVCASQGNVQCSIEARYSTPDGAVAAPFSDPPAEHYICFASLDGANSPCKTSKTDTEPTTTTTTEPPSTTTTTEPPEPSCAARGTASVPPTTSTTVPPTTSVPPTTQPPPTTTTTTTVPAAVPGRRIWKLEAPAMVPPPRESAGMAYDEARDQAVLFGGFDPDGNPCILGDTWTWDGLVWTQHHPEHSPPARYGHAMAFDGTGVVVFGGHDGVRDLADTWTWDGSDWNRRSPAAGPSPRARANATYDEERSEVVLFGGDHAGSALGETWTWDGSEWTQRNPAHSPPPRTDGLMAYYPPAKHTVMVGGWDGERLLECTWTWDGSDWTAHEATWIRVHSAAMAYHPQSQRLIVEGGSSSPGWQAGPGGGYDIVPPFGSAGPVEGTPVASERRTPFWNGSSWGQEGAVSASGGNAVGPPKRRFPAMAADGNGHIVFFGGYQNQIHAKAGTANPPLNAGDPGVRNDTWTYQQMGGQSTDVPPPVTVAGKKITLTLRSAAILADGAETTEAVVKVTRATATVRAGGETEVVEVPSPGERVSFRTSGDVSFSPVVDRSDGTYVTTISASTTPGIETIRAETNSTRPDMGTLNDEYRFLHQFAVNDVLDTAGQAETAAEASLVEEGVVVALDPGTVRADGTSTATATAAVYKAGSLADEQVVFATDGDVTLSPSVRTGDQVWTSRITASRTRGPETITATATLSGLSGSAVLDETITGWTDLTPAGLSPSQRWQAAAAYDSARKQTVLFGGSDHTNPLADTWTWDGSQWTERNPSTSPPARFGHAMAFDEARGQVLLFGGRSGGEDYLTRADTTFLGDTWIWDGTDWKRYQGPGPSPRAWTSMAYDAARQEIVLFGGTDNVKTPYNPNPAPLGDTWTWNGASWTERRPDTPPPPASHPPAEFTNTEPIVVPLPPPPPGCPGVECPADKAQPYPSSISVSGLTGTVADVKVTLKELSYAQSGLADADIMLVAPDSTGIMLMSDACGEDAEAGPITLSFADGATSPLPANSRCSSGTYRPTDVESDESTPFHRPDAFSGPAPPLAAGSSFVRLRGSDPNGTWNLYVVDDGPDNPDPVGEAGRIAKGWTLSVTTTTEATRFVGTPSPPGRGSAAMAYDAVSGKVVLFGGSARYQRHFINSDFDRPTFDSFHPLGDTWTWDGVRWAQEGSGPHPEGFYGAGMVAHPRTGQLFLYVPDDSSDDDDGFLGETWTWNGSGWAKVPSTPELGPPVRSWPAMASDANGRVLLFGGAEMSEGRDVDAAYDDTWAWDATVSVRLESPALPADGKSTTTVRATVTGLDGQPISGLPLTFATDGDVRVSPVDDHGNGTYSATVTASDTEGSETLLARSDLGVAAVGLEEVGLPCLAPALPPDDPTAGRWSPVAPIPRPGNYLAAGTGGDGRIYAFGGYDSRGLAAAEVQSYNPCSGEWTTLPSMPAGTRFGLATASSPDGRIYVTGGTFAWTAWTTLDAVEVFTPGSGRTPARWATFPALPEPRNFHAASLTGRGHLLATGGLGVGGGGGRGCSVGASRYQPGAEGNPGSWRNEPMPFHRAGHQSAPLPDGRVLVFGGMPDCNVPLPGGTGIPVRASPVTDAYVYSDAGDGTWQAMPPMQKGRVLFGGTAGPDGVVYALGAGAENIPLGAIGLNTMSNPTSTTVEAFSLCTGTWLPTEPMPQPRGEHAAVTGGDGRIYVIGGNWGDESVYAYTADPATNPCPAARISDAEVSEDPTQPSTASFRVSLDRPATAAAALAYQTHDGTATAPGDYESATGIVQFAPGEFEKTVDVKVLGDTVPESTEEFSVRLTTTPDQVPSPISPPPGTEAPGTVVPGIRVADGEGIGTIIDAPATPPQMSVAGATVAETFSGSVDATFTVTLSHTALAPVSVGYTTSDGSALADQDYTATTGRLDIPAGVTSATITVPVLGDTVAEGTEDFTLRLSNPSGASLARPVAAGTILDAVGGLSVGDVSVTEGNTATTPATFTITLAGPASGPVAVDYATTGGTARHGSDYHGGTGSLRFEVGETSKTVSVEVVGDQVVEQTEAFNLVLSNAAGAPIARGEGTATIVDDDEDLTPVPDQRPRPQPQPQLPVEPITSPSSAPAVPPLAAVGPAALALLSPSSPAGAEDQPPSAVPPPPVPPQPIPDPLTQPATQSQAQAQQQTQQQTQQQAQQQTQAQAQAQAQASAQVGMMSERQREKQAEQAHAASRDASAQAHLASARRPFRPSPAPLLGFIAALMAAGMALASGNSKGASPARQPVGSRRTPISSRLPGRKQLRPSR